MLDVVSKICSMPRDFYTLKNKSMIQLLIESGYLTETQLVAKEQIANYLQKNSNLINDWEVYSSDKRVAEGWYFLSQESEWVVGYAGSPAKEQKNIYSSGVEACAEFIVREVKQIAEQATRN